MYYSKPTSVSSEKNIADGFNLLQNYPNPFNPTTTINYQLPEPGFVTLKVYDMLGKEVAVLVNEYKDQGSYNAEFSAGSFGEGAASPAVCIFMSCGRTILSQ